MDFYSEPTPERIDRAARAILREECEAHENPDDVWAASDERVRNHYRTLAKAALTS
jgi:hypothetical protein